MCTLLPTHCNVHFVHVQVASMSARKTRLEYAYLRVSTIVMGEKMSCTVHQRNSCTCVYMRRHFSLLYSGTYSNTVKPQ